MKMKIQLSEDDILEAISRYIIFKLGDDIPPPMSKNNIRFLVKDITTEKQLVLNTNALNAEVNI
jgi:hypothetical protein